MRNQLRNIFTSLAQWRQLDRKYVQAVIQIFPELTVGNRSLEVAVRRRDDARVGAEHTGATEPLEFPADIPQFAVVYDKVATGGQPFPEGFAWLAKNGYRTVLHVRAEGEDDSAAKANAERNGLKFLSLDVTPAKLTKDVVAEFSRLVKDVGGHPLFVYDGKGSLAGALWYLHFRTVELQNDDAARIKARALGLSDQGPEATEFQLAIQRYLESR